MTHASLFSTHIVENQPAEILPYNLWTQDPCLKRAVAENGGAWAELALSDYGEVCGHHLMRHGELANEHKPIFKPFDRYGRRIDHVDFHPSYHVLMESAMHAQVHSFSWLNKEKDGAHVARAALLYMHFQADGGTSCPLTMTHAAVAALQHGSEEIQAWIKPLVEGQYDSTQAPAKHKAGLTFGMGMTEKQGGSDVRKNTTFATHNDEGSYSIVGHKFFFSAPMCDAHIILAQTAGGLSCFLLPRVLENGELNNVRIQRLKDKLGDWSNASSEVEFLNAKAHLLGQEGRGINVIIDMVSFTRLDCMIGSSALMRQAWVQAYHHVTNREAFGKKLIDQTLMKNVMADLALEQLASLALTMRLAKAIDESGSNENEARFARLATAVGKYWICKRAPAFANEAQECLGGLGYVEENPLPRLYRQAPLNSIWEGSGNVQCLDVLRTIQKEPSVLVTLFDELQLAAGKNLYFDEHLSRLRKMYEAQSTLEMQSRLIVENTALALQASLLLNVWPAHIGSTFCDARLAKNQGLVFGTLSANAPFDEIIASAALSL